MDSVTAPSPIRPQTLPDAQLPLKPKRRWWLMILIAIIIIGLGIIVWLTTTINPVNKEVATQKDTAKKHLVLAQDKESVGNLSAIHILLAKYLEQHNSYPNQLADLKDIKGYDPKAATTIANAKLSNNQPVYTYKKTDNSYQLCANQLNGQPQCEGPKK